MAQLAMLCTMLRLIALLGLNIMHYKLTEYCTEHCTYYNIAHRISHGIVHHPQAEHCIVIVPRVYVISKDVMKWEDNALWMFKIEVTECENSALCVLTTYPAFFAGFRVSTGHVPTLAVHAARIVATCVTHWWELWKLKQNIYVKQISLHTVPW